MRSGLRWLAGVAAGVVVFEGLDLLGSSPDVLTQLPGAAWLPALSPLLAGVTAAWSAAQSSVPSLLAAAATVWARIGLDLGIGILRGVHLSPEYGIVLVAMFGAPWTAMAVGGGVGIALARWARRTWARSRGG